MVQLPTGDSTPEVWGVQPRLLIDFAGEKWYNKAILKLFMMSLHTTKTTFFGLATLSFMGSVAISLAAYFGSQLNKTTAEPVTAIPAAKAAKPLPAPVGFAKPLPTTYSVQYSTVTKVTKGHEIYVTADGVIQPVRMVGLATPELAQGNLPSQCFALQAQAKTKSDLLGQPVSLLADPTQPDRDVQGRLLRYVYLDGRDYSEQLVAEGYAREFSYHSTPHFFQKRYQQAEREAETAGRGFWAKDTCAGNTLKPGIFVQPNYFSAVSPRSPDGVVNCQSFLSQQEAQRFYEAHEGPFRDPYSLDPQRNGQACSSLP